MFFSPLLAIEIKSLFLVNWSNCHYRVIDPFITNQLERSPNYTSYRLFFIRKTNEYSNIFNITIDKA